MDFALDGGIDPTALAFGTLAVTTGCRGGPEALTLGSALGPTVGTGVVVLAGVATGLPQLWMRKVGINMISVDIMGTRSHCMVCLDQFWTSNIKLIVKIPNLTPKRFSILAISSSAQKDSTDEADRASAQQIQKGRHGCGLGCSGPKLRCNMRFQGDPQRKIKGPLKCKGETMVTPRDLAAVGGATTMT